MSLSNSLSPSLSLSLHFHLLYLLSLDNLFKEGLPGISIKYECELRSVKRNVIHNTPPNESIFDGKCNNRCTRNCTILKALT